MHASRKFAVLMASALALQAGQAWAQAAATTEEKPFAAGTPLGVTAADGATTPLSDNVKVYGAIVGAESCVYDAERGLILAVNRGVNQNQVPNDGFVALINHDNPGTSPSRLRAISVNSLSCLRMVSIPIESR
jgi:hypothetical protein